MSKKKHKRMQHPTPERRVSIRSVLRQPLDEKKLARALLAIAANEVAARADHEQRHDGGRSPEEAA